MKTGVLILFLLIVIVMPVVTAAGFSPSSLTFELDRLEEGCGEIEIDSDSPKIEVFDVWAENRNVDWRVSLFDTSADEHGLVLTYPSELSINEREVEVCLLGVEDGEYHGAIIFRQEQEGTSVIQLAVWLKALIGEVGVGDTGVASGVGSVVEEELGVLELNEGGVGRAPITGAAVGEGWRGVNLFGVMGITTLILFVVLVLVLMRRGKEGGRKTQTSGEELSDKSGGGEMEDSGRSGGAKVSRGRGGKKGGKK